VFNQIDDSSVKCEVHAGSITMVFGRLVTLFN
jgi:hypothetical protein